MAHGAAMLARAPGEHDSIQTYARIAMLMVVFRRVFGVGMIFTGAAFVAHTVLLILAPAYASDLLLATAAVTFIPLILWLLVKGVNEKAWSRASRP